METTQNMENMLDLLRAEITRHREIDSRLTADLRAENERLREALTRLADNAAAVQRSAAQQATDVPARTTHENGIPDTAVSAARMLHAAYARGVAVSFSATLWQARAALAGGAGGEGT